MPPPGCSSFFFFRMHNVVGVRTLQRCPGGQGFRLIRYNKPVCRDVRIVYLFFFSSKNGSRSSSPVFEDAPPVFPRLESDSFHLPSYAYYTPVCYRVMGTLITVNVSRPRRVRNRLNYNINTIIIIIMIVVLLLVWNNIIVHNDGVRYRGASIC